MIISYDDHAEDNQQDGKDDDNHDDIHWESGQQQLMIWLWSSWKWGQSWGQWRYTMMMITCSRDFRQEARTSSVGDPPLGSTPTPPPPPDPSSLSWGPWWSWSSSSWSWRWEKLLLFDVHSSYVQPIIPLRSDLSFADFPFSPNVHFSSRGGNKISSQRNLLR